MNAFERTSVVLPHDLRQQIIELARAEDRSVSAQIRLALREYVRSTPRPERRVAEERP
jgi:hypothetical protein